MAFQSAIAVLPPLLAGRRALAAPAPALLDPRTQAQYVNALPNPLDPRFAFAPTGTFLDPSDPGRWITRFDLQISQFRAQTGLVGPGGEPLTTTLWGYGTAQQDPTWPGRTFQVHTGWPVQVSYNNRLLGSDGATLPPLFPIDTTLDWAATGNNGATAPVPLVAHLHGGHSQYLSDGLPDAWETPNEAMRGVLWSKPYTYDNAQEAAHLFYHDHALGVTRQNVYAGLAGNYFIRGDDELALVATGQLPAFPYEVALAIQDRRFFASGELYYPSDPALYPFDPDAGPTIPLPPITHLPEFFGDVMVVNGIPWPRLDVEPRQYRLRVLNGSDARVYELRVETGAVPGAGTPAPMFVIGNALGLLNAPVPVGLLRIAPGERYDVVVDFAGLHGQVLTLTNSAKTPYPDGDPPETGLADQLMQFNVSLKPRDTPAPASLPTNLRPVSGSLAPPDASAAVKTRKILMVEGTDPYGRLMTMLGPIDSSLPAPLQGTLFYKDPVTETPALGSTEIWEFYNTTVDAHPMHIHLVEFRVLNRQRFTIRGSDPDGDPHENLQAKDMGGGFIGGIVDASAIGFTDPDTGAPFPVNPPPAWEAGKKDTVLAFPGEVTRVLVTFRRSGTYVYHCHILSHEDHEMMRPYQVVAPPATAAQTVRAD